jgi:hypothetical protein
MSLMPCVIEELLGRKLVIALPRLRGWPHPRPPLSQLPWCCGLLLLLAPPLPAPLPSIMDAYPDMKVNLPMPEI